MKPISKTAFYCCGVRMQDAASAAPVLGDVYAKVFMNEDGMRIIEAFKDETSPNASNVARHRIIDDFLRRELSAAPDLMVVTIGAGFDTRPYRLEGGTWIEFDEPQIIAYKNERLPAADARNPLQRVPIDFASESLEEKLISFLSDRPVTVVIEGVFMYLTEEEINDLLQTLRRLFPTHKLICDLMNREFFEKNSRTLHEKINDIGAAFRFAVDDPERIFLENEYRRAEKVSIVGRAASLGLLAIPESVLKNELRDLAEGLAIYVFETRQS